MNAFDLLWNTDLRLSIAPPLAAAALYVAGRGAATSWKALHLSTATPGKNVALMSSFRTLITGSAVACLALGWLLNVPALALTAAVIGLGELFETSIDVYALRQSELYEKRRLRPRT